MSRRALLWAVFLVVHVGVAVLGWVLPNQPMGDVYLVYEPWATRALDGHGIVGITEPFVYPQLALLPMVAAQSLSWIAGYIVGWAVVVTALDALAFHVLVGSAPSRGRVAAAWFWLIAIALLGPVGMYRIDAITVPLALLGLLWLATRPAVAAALLAVATWIKVWPAALLLTAVIAVKARMRVVLAAAAVSAAVAAAVVVAGGSAHLFGFVGEQTGRGLQIEAPISAFYMWQALAGVPGARVYYSTEMLTYQVTGSQVDAVIAVMTPALAVAALAVALLGAVKCWRGASMVRLLPPLALSLVLVLIVVNKVGSPQFMTWLIAPLVFWLVVDRARAAVPVGSAMVLMALTQAVYPMAYHDLLAGWPYALVLLTARNVLLVFVLGWSVVSLARVPVRERARGTDTGAQPLTSSIPVPPAA